MKKALSLILALTLCLALTSPALAARIDNGAWHVDCSPVNGTEQATICEYDWENGKAVRSTVTVYLVGPSEKLSLTYQYPTGDTAYFYPSVVTYEHPAFIREDYNLKDVVSGEFLDAAAVNDYLQAGSTGEYTVSYSDDSAGKTILTIGAVQYAVAFEDVNEGGAYHTTANTLYAVKTEGVTVYFRFTNSDGSMPAVKSEVVPTNQKLTVNGIAKNTEIYNIDGYNYFKLRDMAMLLNGTSSQFSVDYDAARNIIVVKTSAAYASVGGELTVPSQSEMKGKAAYAVNGAQSVEIDGRKANLIAFNIGGNNFFRLRELGTALGFDVDYDNATATMIVKSK